jgi:simple sugar transport system ATP-binding protein
MTSEMREQPGPAGGEVVAAVRNLTKRFPGVVANDGVSLAFRAGEIHVLLGENGAGKSTLIGMLAGMQQPDGGEILIARPASARSARRASAWRSASAPSSSTCCWCRA